MVVVLSVATNAFSWGEVKKSKEFMQACMYPQAIELLTKRINDKPADGEAIFSLVSALSTPEITAKLMNDLTKTFFTAINME